MRSNHRHNDVTKTSRTYFVGCGSRYLHSTFTRWQLLHFGRCSSHFCLRSRQLSQAFYAAVVSSGMQYNLERLETRHSDIDVTDSISPMLLEGWLTWAAIVPRLRTGAALGAVPLDPESSSMVTHDLGPGEISAALLTWADRYRS